MIRSLFLAAASVLLAVMPASAQKWAEKMFETTGHDFGTIARRAKAEHAFVLKNIYTETVHIASVRVTCGCTTPRIPESLLETYQERAMVASIRGKKPFRIISITADCDCFPVCAPEAESPKALYVVPVTFTAAGEPQSISQAVRVQTDLGIAPLEPKAYAAVIVK